MTRCTAAGKLHLEFLVAVCVGLHGLQDEWRKLQLLLLQRRPELRGQDDGGQGQRRLLLLAQPRLLLTDVTVDPARVGHVLTDREGLLIILIIYNAAIITFYYHTYLY